MPNQSQQELPPQSAQTRRHRQQEYLREHPELIQIYAAGHLTLQKILQGHSHLKNEDLSTIVLYWWEDENVIRPFKPVCEPDLRDGWRYCTKPHCPDEKKGMNRDNWKRHPDTHYPVLCLACADPDGVMGAIQNLRKGHEEILDHPPFFCSKSQKLANNKQNNMESRDDFRGLQNFKHHYLQYHRGLPTRNANQQKGESSETQKKKRKREPSKQIPQKKRRVKQNHQEQFSLDPPPPVQSSQFHEESDMFLQCQEGNFQQHDPQHRSDSQEQRTDPSFLEEQTSHLDPHLESEQLSFQQILDEHPVSSPECDPEDLEKLFRDENFDSPVFFDEQCVTQEHQPEDFCPPQSTEDRGDPEEPYLECAQLNIDMLSVHEGQKQKEQSPQTSSSGLFEDDSYLGLEQEIMSPVGFFQEKVIVSEEKIKFETQGEREALGNLDDLDDLQELNDSVDLDE